MPDRRNAQIRIRPPSRLRRKDQKEFEEKFADSYGECVSVPSSYRRKRQRPTVLSAVDVERRILQNISNYRRLLDEHDERVRAQADNVSMKVPVLNAVKNFLQRDLERNMRRAFKKWIQFTAGMRVAERARRKLAEQSVIQCIVRALSNAVLYKTRRALSENAVDQCIEEAISNLIEGKDVPGYLPSFSGNDEQQLRIQKWTNKTTLSLEGGSADGRVSHFGIPQPNIHLPKYKAKRNESVFLWSPN